MFIIDNNVPERITFDSNKYPELEEGESSADEVARQFYERQPAVGGETRCWAAIDFQYSLMRKGLEHTEATVNIRWLHEWVPIDCAKASFDAKDGSGRTELDLS